MKRFTWRQTKNFLISFPGKAARRCRMIWGPVVEAARPKLISAKTAGVKAGRRPPLVRSALSSTNRYNKFAFTDARCGSNSWCTTAGRVPLHRHFSSVAAGAGDSLSSLISIVVPMEDTPLERDVLLRPSRLTITATPFEGYWWFWYVLGPEYLTSNPTQPRHIWYASVDAPLILPCDTGMFVAVAADYYFHNWGVSNSNVNIRAGPGTPGSDFLIFRRPGLHVARCDASCGANCLWKPIGIEAVERERFLERLNGVTTGRPRAVRPPRFPA